MRMSSSSTVNSNSDSNNNSNSNSDSKKILRLPLRLPRSLTKTPPSGLFIHWGVYSIPGFTRVKRNKKNTTYNGSEWYLGWIKNRGLYGSETMDYHTANYGDSTLEQVEKRYYGEWLDGFNECADGNWEQYAKTAVRLGMQYIILTIKHHDGISLFPSNLSKDTHRPHTNKDHVQEFVCTCRKYGLKVGLYYSLMEWSNLRQGITFPYTKGHKLSEYTKNVMWPSLKEICQRYKPDILWADGHWNHSVAEWGSLEFLEWFHTQYPNSIVNDRWGKDFNDILKSSEHLQKFCYETGSDRYFPSTQTRSSFWEHVNTIGDSWGFAHNQVDFKTAEAIFQLKKRVWLANGRFTLNIGPQMDGTLHPSEQRVLD